MKNSDFYPPSFIPLVDDAETCFAAMLDTLDLSIQEWHRQTVTDADLDEDRRDDLMTAWGKYLDDYPPEYDELPTDLIEKVSSEVVSVYGNMPKDELEYKIAEYIWRDALEDAEDNLLDKALIREL